MTKNIKQKIIYGRLKGSYTLEAAMVMPIVLFTIISVMYFVFYMHDRMVIDMCAYHSAIESVFTDETRHSIAKKNIANLNTLTITPTSTWTEGTAKMGVKYMGKYAAPFTAMKVFLDDEKIKGSAYAYQKMKIRNMYVIKVVRNIILKRIMQGSGEK